jgi:amidophosphoribosyltransferase
VKWPCFYGIDFATRAELIANGLSTDEICASIGADSLAYISLEQLIEATSIPGDDLCHACFDGQYPIPLPEPEHLGKHLLETQPGALDVPSTGLRTSPSTGLRTSDGLATSLTGAGAADALDRP